MNPEPQSDRHRVLHRYTDPNQFLKCSILSMLGPMFCWCAHPNRLFGDGKDCLSGAQCLCAQKGTYGWQITESVYIIHVCVIFIQVYLEMALTNSLP